MVPMNEPFTMIRDDVPWLFFVQGEHNGSYPNSNALLVETNEHTHEALLIDCGVGPATIRKLKKKFTITHIYLSHWHEDHTLDHGLLQDATFHCHPADIPPLLDRDLLVNLYGFEGHADRDRFVNFMDSLGVAPFPDVQPMTEAGIAAPHGHNLEIIHAPGHSAGHCVFYEPDLRIAFLADVDFSGFGPWYGGMDSSLFDFISTIDKIASLDIDIAISSHKGIIVGDDAGLALRAYREKIETRNATILELLSETTPKSAIDLVEKNVVYRNYDKFKGYLLVAERIMIEYHLGYLESKQRVIRDRNGYLRA